MKIAIVGFGLEGQSSYDYYSNQGSHDITICDQNKDTVIPEGTKSNLGENYLDGLNSFDLIVRSSGIMPSLITDKHPETKDRITTQINEFLKVCPTKNIVGITGTKGKGTTSTLVAKMLEASVKKVFLGGNIGIAALTLLDKITPESFVVLELSSFQLIDLSSSSPHIAVCLMVVPEHLNWHKDMNEYIEAKSRLFLNQTEDDVAIYFAGSDLSTQIASKSKGQLIPFYSDPGAFIESGNVVIDNQLICKTDELKLLGKHNWQNVCAAVTAIWQIDKNIEAIRSVLTTFTGLEHRLEFVREVNGVKYYNDSFGTTPETAIAAMAAFNEPEVVILGGQPKNIGFDSLASAISNNKNVKKILVIGEASEEIIKALENVGFKDFVASDSSTMPDIVREVTDLAKEIKAATGQDVVALLSTAATSFDMFNNYKERGELFKKAVLELS